MIKDLKKNFQVVKYVFVFCKMYIFYTILYIIANTVINISKVYLVREIVTVVIQIIDEGVLTFNDVLERLVIYLVVVTIATIVRTYYNSYVKGKYRVIYTSMMRKMMFEKAKLVDYENFDNPEFYDMYSRAMRDGVFRGMRVYEDFTNFISSLVNTLALGTFIVISDPILIAIILVSVITRIIISQKVNKNIQKYDKETEIDRRMYGYVNRTFYQERFAAEIKTTNIGELLIDRCEVAQKNIDEKCIQTYKKNTFLNSGSSIITNLFELGGTYIYLLIRLFQDIGIANFSSMITATKQFSNNFYSMADFLNRIKINALYIDYFLDYMSYKPSLETVGHLDVNDPFEKLEINNVSFHYPLVEKNALSNINLTISKKEKLAIVGLNGAGKTTLIKLLLKFYNPSEGEILYNGIDCREIKEDVIRSKYSIVFQDYRLYGISIGENILMREIKTQEDEEIVWNALDKVDMKEKVMRLEKGIRTIYSREFGNDGVTFSGGEMQKIVIARVFASNANIYIMDEPTSNLDPLSEKEINDLIMKKSEDKTIILIAHRLSTVVEADRIILIEYGKIIEDGTHEELLKLNGKYSEMFETQGKLYKNRKR